MPLVYDELRRIANRYLRREREGHTLQTTALVHEAYFRIIDQQRVDWQNRAHFMAVAARLMRRVLVDIARAKAFQKRGGGAVKVTLDEAMVAAQEPDYLDLVAIDEALKRLASVDARKAQVIELRFFGGLGLEETAAVLKVSVDTVKRDSRLAKAWLLREMKGNTPRGTPHDQRRST